MKYKQLQSFIRDLRRLSQAERDILSKVVRYDFHPACEQFAREPGASWPRGLRVKRVQGISGVWEMTWSFAGPDGRATFEWIEIDGELGVRWRCVGGHERFRQP